MSKRMLITGGAGFIGSHLADELLAHGYQVRVLDNLNPQVHGPGGRRPDYLDQGVELVVGDVCRPEDVRRALQDCAAVFHLAAMVGVGQSMYAVRRYTEVNNLGTAVLLEALADRPVERLLVASSMSVYGEGSYQTPDGRPGVPLARTREQFQEGDWECYDAEGHVLVPVPTPESKPPALSSVYALSKFDQERLCLLLGAAYRIPTVALRLFNVYGPRQALSNPYTGVLAIFGARLLNQAPPLLYEDGYQQRDFVHVRDVAAAFRLALEAPAAPGLVFNIGSGQPWPVREIATRMAAALGRPRIEPQLTGQYRVGDIRHCFADIALARRELGYAPRVPFEEGLRELAAWLEHQPAVDRVEQARAELEQRGLTV